MDLCKISAERFFTTLLGWQHCCAVRVQERRIKGRTPRKVLAHILLSGALDPDPTLLIVAHGRSRRSLAVVAAFVGYDGLRRGSVAERLLAQNNPDKDRLNRPHTMFATVAPRPPPRHVNTRSPSPSIPGSLAPSVPTSLTLPFPLPPSRCLLYTTYTHDTNFIPFPFYTLVFNPDLSILAFST